MAYAANTYAGGDVAALNLQQIENNFEYLRTSFAGAAAPADPGGGLEGVIWRDTNNSIFRARGDSSWLGIFACDNSGDNGVIPVYRNAAIEGWAVDGDITDKVIALKGGAQAYNANGGTTAGSWTLSGITTVNESSHTHTVNSHAHSIPYNNNGYIGNADPVNLTGGTTGSASPGTSGGSAHNHSVSHDATDRPAAALCTMQYPDI